MTGRALLTLLVLAFTSPVTGQPVGVEALLAREYRFTPADLARLRAGEAIARLVATPDSTEVALVGAIRIGVSPEVTAACVRDIERFETGRRFLATRKLSEPPRLDDFLPLQLPRDDIAALRKCRPGRCEVKLDQDQATRLADFDWRATGRDARLHGLVRDMALTRVEAYRATGNAALPVYIDKAAPVASAQAFGALVARARPLLDRAPGLVAYLEHYPATLPAGADDLFYWSLADFGLKPLFRVNHLVIAPIGDGGRRDFITATKQLYASHYFHTALEVRLLAADADMPGDSHYLVALSLARADGFTGLLGGLLRSRVRAATLDGMLGSLRATKRRAEGHTGK